MRATANPQLSATVLSTPVFGDVTSANIVGYTAIQTEGGGLYTQLTPQFVEVNDNTKIKLSSIKFTPINNDTIQVFNTDGDVEVLLQYRTNKKVDGVVKPGWFLDNKTYIDDWEFDRGQSIWFCTANETDGTISGAVAKGKNVVTIPGSGLYVQTGNSTPVAFNLSQLEIPNLVNNDTIQIFNSDGDVDVLLQYRTNKKVDGVLKPGWFLDNKTWIDDTTYPIPAGLAFWVCCANEGSMTIPAAIDDEE